MGDLKLPTIYRAATFVKRIYNEKLIEETGLVSGSAEALEFARFVRVHLLGDRWSPRYEYYRMLLCFLEGTLSHRGIKCMEMRDGGMLDSNGDFFVCSVSGVKVGNITTDKITPKMLREARSYTRDKFCDGCIHDHRSHVPPNIVLRELGKEVLKVAGLLKGG